MIKTHNQGDKQVYVRDFRYNGQIPSGDRGRRKSKFQFQQRQQANGLKFHRQKLCKTSDEIQVKRK